MNDGPDITPADLDPGIVARARARDAPVVILPLRETDEIGIYPQGTLTLGKRLRAEGVGAVYLHDSEHRRFEVKKGFVLEAVEALLLGIGSSAGWDAIKALLARSKSRQLEVTYLELETPEGKGAAWKAVGEADAVARAIDLIRTPGGGRAPAKEHAPRVAAAAATAFEAAGSDEDLRLDHLRDQIARRRHEAERLRAAAENALANDPPDWAIAEQQARQALHFYARSLDWAEDTAAEEEAHRLMDEAGAWVRSTFGCWVAKEGDAYRQTCPVALAHNRLGFSIGGSATRICSLCGDDLSECEHLPGVAYMVPGGSAGLGWCRVCLEEACDHNPEDLYRVSVVARIEELDVSEISLVTKPANPEARLIRVDVPVSELQAEFGSDFVPGPAIRCDRCLSPCDGLIKHDSLRP